MDSPGLPSVKPTGRPPAVGINVLRYKVINFSIACFFAGLGGALLAHSEQTISPQAGSAFGVMTTMYLLIYMVVGGKSRFTGPVCGAVFLSLVMEFTRPMQEYQPMFVGGHSHRGGSVFSRKA